MPIARGALPRRVRCLHQDVAAGPEDLSVYRRRALPVPMHQVGAVANRAYRNPTHIFLFLDIFLHILIQLLLH